MKIKKTTINDIPYFIKWFSDSENTRFMITKKLTKKQMLKFLNDENRCFYTIWLDKPIGYCQIRFIKNTKRIGLLIDKKYWGKGYAQQIIKKMKLKYKNLTAECFNLNKPIQHILNKFDIKFKIIN